MLPMLFIFIWITAKLESNVMPKQEKYIFLTYEYSSPPKSILACKTLFR